MLLFQVQRDGIDRLQEPDEEIRYLVVRKLGPLSVTFSCDSEDHSAPADQGRCEVRR